MKWPILFLYQAVGIRRYSSLNNINPSGLNENKREKMKNKANTW